MSRNLLSQPPTFDFSFGQGNVVRSLIDSRFNPLANMVSRANTYGGSSFNSFLNNQLVPPGSGLFNRTGPSSTDNLATAPEVMEGAVGAGNAEAVDFSSTRVSSAEEASEDLLEGAEAAEGPVGMAEEAGQMAGQFLNLGLGSLGESNALQAYTNSLNTGHGIGVQEIANAQLTSDKTSLGLQNAIGSAGAFLGGPIGVLLGRGIASFIPTTPNLNVANSNYGMFNPQSSDISTSQSQSSAELAPNFENVDTTSS